MVVSPRARVRSLPEQACGARPGRARGVRLPAPPPRPRACGRPFSGRPHVRWSVSNVASPRERCARVRPASPALVVCASMLCPSVRLVFTRALCPPVCVVRLLRSPPVHPLCARRPHGLSWPACAGRRCEASACTLCPSARASLPISGWQAAGAPRPCVVHSCVRSLVELHHVRFPSMRGARLRAQPVRSRRMLSCVPRRSSRAVIPSSGCLPARSVPVCPLCSVARSVPLPWLTWVHFILMFFLDLNFPPGWYPTELVSRVGGGWCW